MELSSILSAHSKTILGKQQLIMSSFAKALEIIPRQVSDNAGMDSTDVLNKLRNEHFRKTIADAPATQWAGVDVMNEGITDTFITGVWEPAANKMNSIAAATEAASCVLSIDETVKNPLSEKPQGPSAAEQRAGRQMVSQGMGGGGLREGSHAQLQGTWRRLITRGMFHHEFIKSLYILQLVTKSLPSARCIDRKLKKPCRGT